VHPSCGDNVDELLGVEILMILIRILKYNKIRVWITAYLIREFAKTILLLLAFRGI
jgi:hypothetical protein